MITEIPDTRQHDYATGKTKPNYPVPAIRGWNYDKDSVTGYTGGVEGDCVMVGATYVDWSRGFLEFY